MPIPRDLTSADVLAAVASYEAGEGRDVFGVDPDYWVEVGGHYYPPKAIVGLAARRVLSRMLLPSEFSGGKGAGQANQVLERLGFTIIRSGGPGQDWTSDEVRETVASYFAMLRLELRGEKYSKSEFRRELRLGLQGRTQASVEFKHANISAVLAENDLPYIKGYQPRGNYQDLLAKAVDEYLLAHPDLRAEMAASIQDPPVTPPRPPARLEIIVVAPPAVPTEPPPAVRVTPRLAVAGALARRDDQNRSLGAAGEEFVVELERAELRALGRADLAERVTWVARTVGDGLGYDVLSFDGDGAEKHIEVKTTNGDARSSFYVTANELAASAELAGSFHLYRLFDFRTQPRLFILRGNLVSQLQLQPTLYRTRW